MFMDWRKLLIVLITINYFEICFAMEKEEHSKIVLIPT